MRPPRAPYACLRCRTQYALRIPSRRNFATEPSLEDSIKANIKAIAETEKAESRPSIAPRISLDLKHIRENVTQHKRNCLNRNYGRQSSYPALIESMHAEWQSLQREAVSLRRRNNLVMQAIAKPNKLAKMQNSPTAEALSKMSREDLIEESRSLKKSLSSIEEKEASLTSEIDRLALALPVLSSDATPIGSEPKTIKTFNDDPAPPFRPGAQMPLWRSHVDIGEDLNLFDFGRAAKTSGWGWYYLLNEAAQMEQALVHYALDMAMKRGWSLVSPPSMVYSHIASACGFQPRDNNDEQQIYSIAQSDEDRGVRPSHSLAGTAEIPLAAMEAGKKLDPAQLPIKRVAVSRSYRAEAGSRGKATQGLYRVHEFTKVEMFAWTLPDMDVATKMFNEIVELQIEIISSLGLCGRVLEMPTTDLGASAMRKQDIEVWFPGRQHVDDGWGELTSTSICGDYQSRRLDTRIKAVGAEKASFPYTLNGTAMAVPRVIAAIIENGWREHHRSVFIPEVLRPYMGGKETIGPAENLGVFGIKPRHVPVEA